MGRLKEQLLAQERFIAERGYYVERMELAEADPIKYEVFHSRLLSTLQSARETAKMVSASPAVRESEEVVFALYTLEGDAVAFSTGIMAHVNTMSRCIKWMLMNDYEELVGFAEGDYFANNDPYVGGLHVPDVMDITPLFWEGELVGWIGGVTHMIEVGAVEPGSMPMSAVTRFHEGKIVTPTKIGEGDQLYRDYEVQIERSIRSPLFWILDEKAKIAGCRIVRDSVKEVIGEYGIGYYRGVVREIIEDGRRRLLAKVRQVCYPGRYRSVSYVDSLLRDQPGIPVAAARDLLLHAPLEVTITREGGMVFDFDGASSWGMHPQNCTPAAMEGGLYVAMSQFLSYDGKMNAGNALGTELRLPYGSFCNPDNIFAATARAWNSLIAFWGNWYRALSYAFYARGYREEILASPATTGGLVCGGINQYGARFGGMPGDGVALGSGGRGVMDGIDTGYTLWNPTTDLGNLELFELLLPLLYLGRSVLPSSGGYGKYRGGNAPESIYMTYYPGYLEMGSMACVYKIFDQPGVMGGYPGMGRYMHIARGTNLKELIKASKPLPHCEGDPADPEMHRLVEAERWELGACAGYVSRPIGSYELVEMCNAAGGGYGDPLDRDPELVRRDLEQGMETPRMAGAIYGVEIDPQSLQVDQQRTQGHREALRRERRARGIPAQDYWEQERRRVLGGRLSEAVKEMYRDSFKLSPRFVREFREFWHLPDDFTL